MYTVGPPPSLSVRTCSRPTAGNFAGKFRCTHAHRSAPAVDAPPMEEHPSGISAGRLRKLALGLVSELGNAAKEG